MLPRSIKSRTKSEPLCLYPWEEAHSQAPSLPKACPGQKSAHKWQGQLLATLWGRWLSSHVKDILGRKRRTLKMVIMGNWSFSDFLIQDFIFKKNPFRTYTYFSSWSLTFTSSGWSDGYLPLFFILDKINVQKQKGSLFMPHLTSFVCTPVFAGCKFDVFNQCLYDIISA